MHATLNQSRKRAGIPGDWDNNACKRILKRIKIGTEFESKQFKAGQSLDLTIAEGVHQSRMLATIYAARAKERRQAFAPIALGSLCNLN